MISRRGEMEIGCLFARVEHDRAALCRFAAART
jgi:hypothetical protein